MKKWSQSLSFQNLDAAARYPFSTFRSPSSTTRILQNVVDEMHARTNTGEYLELWIRDPREMDELRTDRLRLPLRSEDLIPHEIREFVAFLLQQFAHDRKTDMTFRTEDKNYQPRCVCSWWGGICINVLAPGEFTPHLTVHPPGVDPLGFASHWSTRTRVKRCQGCVSLMIVRRLTIEAMRFKRR